MTTPDSSGTRTQAFPCLVTLLPMASGMESVPLTALAEVEQGGFPQGNRGSGCRVTPK